MEEKDIQFSDSVEYLGINIKSDLSWKIEERCHFKEVFEKLEWLNCIKSVVPIENRRKLILTWIVPILEFYIQSINHIMLKVETDENDFITEKELLKVIESCIMFVRNSGKIKHITNCFQKVKMMSLDMRIGYFFCFLCYTNEIIKVPTDLLKDFPFSMEFPLDILKVFWDEIPEEVKLISKFEDFEEMLHKWLISESGLLARQAVRLSYRVSLGPRPTVGWHGRV